MGRQPWARIGRPEARPRGKWHLLIGQPPSTICRGERAGEWQQQQRSAVAPDEVCTRCVASTA